MGSNVGLQVVKLLSLSCTGKIHCAYMGYFILCTGFLVWDQRWAPPTDDIYDTEFGAMKAEGMASADLPRNLAYKFPGLMHARYQKEGSECTWAKEILKLVDLVMQHACCFVSWLLQCTQMKVAHCCCASLWACLASLAVAIQRASAGGCC